MITQNQPIVNEKINIFEEHKQFAINIQQKLSNIFRNPRTNNPTRKSENILSCGSSLEFQHYFNEEDTRTLRSANFCKHKLCPMCAWRWHLKNNRTLSKAFEILGKQDYYHLVLTIPNLKFITKEFLIELRKKAGLFMKKIAKSIDYFMSFEITIDENGCFHPHYHILYINHLEKPLTRKQIQTEWAKIANTGNNYAICLQKKCTDNKISQELTKYILKFEDFNPNEKTLKIIDMATKGLKKTCARGEILNAKLQAEKELEKEDFEKMNTLKNFDSEIEWYLWFSNCYNLQKRKVDENKC